VGLTGIKMNGNSSDSYWSPSGYIPGGMKGAIASNGNITLSGAASIEGDARPGIGKSVSGGTVSGSTAPLTVALSYANGDAGNYATTNDNALSSPAFSGGAGDITTNTTLPAGNYYVHDINLSSGETLTCTGKVTIYCYHNLQ